MRGYPKGPLSKVDYENLLAMPEHAYRAKEDLGKLAVVDDAKIFMDQGTQDVPKLVQIANPLPMWKRAGFRHKADLMRLADTEGELIDEKTKIVARPGL